MRKRIQNAASMLLTVAFIISALTVSAFAKSDKANKSGKEPSSAVCDGPAAITIEEAKGIALAQAGVGSGDVIFIRERLDKTVYVLEFTTLGTKYEYKIAVDGTILSCKTKGQTTLDTRDSFEAAGHPLYEAEVSWSQARQAALDDAGLDGTALQHIVCGISWADHVPHAYEVKFSTREAYYHYTIDLHSGVILSNYCVPHR